MKNLLTKLFSWILHNFGVLFIIFSVLIVGKFCKDNWCEYKSLLTEYSLLEKYNNIIEVSINSGVKDATKQIQAQGETIKHTDILVPRAADAALDSLDKQISDANKDIIDKELEIQKYSNIGEIIAGKSISETQVISMRLNVEKKIFERKKLYLSNLKAWLASKITERDNMTNLEKLVFEKLSFNKKLDGKDSEIESFKQQYPYKWMVPFTVAHQNYSLLKSQKDALEKDCKTIDTAYSDLLSAIENNPVSDNPPDLKVARSDFDVVVAPFSNRFLDLKNQLDTKWVGKFMMQVFSVSSTAFQILFFIIITPFFIKALFYFVLAPIASRRPPVRLLPDITGDLSLESGHSSVSQSISVDEKSELLIHPEFLQSSSIEGTKDTQWLLDWKYPLTSLASNMVVLTKIKTTRPATFVLSASNDPFSEIGILSIPHGGAIVMQPHNLVGVRQPIGKTVHISSHWRLNSLHAWLTLQLRYLAFHGPVDLIVQGCRGVRLERADSGRSINQAATIGFSANLSYATRRSETFGAYFLGKQELLNDVFEGKNGFYVYEEMPHFGKKAGLTGRGLEGLTDSMLKVLGI